MVQFTTKLFNTDLGDFHRYMAFTLSEILVTLGIIGVVAAVTIPTLMSNAQKKDDYSKLLKAYSAITNVSNTLRSENGGEFTGLATTNLELANLFKPYMNVLKFCQNLTESPNCYLANSANVYTLNGGLLGGTTPYYFAGEPKMLTTDGIMYDFEIASSSCGGPNYVRNGVNENCGAVMIDINGAKLPNTDGKDVFHFSINKYNTTTPKIGALFDCDKAASAVYNGVGCDTKAISEGGIYYY